MDKNHTPERRAVARSTATIAILAGAAWLALGGESVVRPDPRSYRDELFLVPWVLYASTLTGVHILARGRANRVERIGFTVVILAMVVTAAGNAGIALGVDAMRAIAFPLGPAGFIAGMVAFGVGVGRARVLPRRVGTLVALAQPLAMATGVALSPLLGLHETGSYPGALAHGAVVLVLAGALRALGSQDESSVSPLAANRS